jgi:outer membrane protein
MTEEFNHVPENQPTIEPDIAVAEENMVGKCKNRKQCIMFGLNIASIAGVIVLFILFFTVGKHPKYTPPKSVEKVSYAYVNTDTIMAHYDFVLDVQVDLANYEKQLQNQYTNAAAAFKKEYDDYIKRASANLLTLDQQKKTEEQLAAKQQNIGEMEQNLGMQLQEAKLKRNMEVFDTIINLIKRYNQTKDYTFIFQQSYGGGLLYANPTLDITSDILKGLNEEYAERIKNKKSDSDAGKTDDKAKK